MVILPRLESSISKSLPIIEWAVVPLRMKARVLISFRHRYDMDLENSVVLPSLGGDMYNLLVRLGLLKDF